MKRATASRKPNGNPRTLHNRLTAAQREELNTWLVDENLTYAKAEARLLERFNVKTHHDTLSRYYTYHVNPWKYARARQHANDFAKLASGKFDEATLKRARQLAFEALTDRDPNIAAARGLLKIVADASKQTLAERRLAFDTDKFRQSIKADAEKGLDALFAELEGDPEALALFDRMRNRVMQTLEEAA